MPMPSSMKAMNIVFSRPIWSETQPKKGRVIPLSTRSIDSANCSAGSVNPRIDTGTVSILKSLAMGASCAVAISPPVPTMTNMAYMTQNGTVASTSAGTVVASGLQDRGGGWHRYLAGLRRTQEEREDDDNDPLADAEPPEG